MPKYSSLRKFAESLFERLTPFQIAALVLIALFVATCALRLMASRSRQTKFEVAYTNPVNQTLKPTGAGKVTMGPNLVDPAILYSDRLREGSALAIGLSLAVLDERLKNKRFLTNLEQILEAAKTRKLLPPLARVHLDKRTVESDLGIYYFSYRAAPFTLEVTSTGFGGAKLSGDNFVLRVPDESGTDTSRRTVGDGGKTSDGRSGRNKLTAYATLWTSPEVSARLPAPFAAAEEYRAAGWRQEVVRTADVDPEKLTRLAGSFKPVATLENH